MRQSNARKLRKHPTDAERLLWRHLRLRQLGGYKFRRQQPLGPYIVDFVCLEQRLCIEVDGGQHAEQAEEDARRSAWMEVEGFRVLRFWNTEVLQETAAVKEMIRAALDDDPPSSILPRKGGGSKAQQPPRGSKNNRTTTSTSGRRVGLTSSPLAGEGGDGGYRP